MPPDPFARLAELEGVSSGLAAARDAVDAVLRDRGRRRTPPALTAESLLRGAVASARLEGSAATDTEIRAGRGDAVALAAVRVSTQVLGLAGTLRTAPLQVFARLHAVAAAGELAGDRVGRPRDADAAAALRDLAGRLVAPTSAPALLVAAVAHAEIAVAAPFSSHNGLVARAVERLVLVQRGVDPVSLTVPEVGHLALRPAYEERLAALREAPGADTMRAWLRYAGTAITRGAEASPVGGG